MLLKSTIFWISRFVKIFMITLQRDMLVEDRRSDEAD